MPDTPEILKVFLQRGVVIDADGEELPIITMYDEWGEECEDPDDAVAISAGRPGYYVAVTLED